MVLYVIWQVNYAIAIFFVYISPARHICDCKYLPLPQYVILATLESVTIFQCCNIS